MQKIFFPSSRPRFLDREEVVKKLRELASKIARENGDVEAVYLFGSYAQGNASLRSDADVLVVLSESTQRNIDRLDEFILKFSAAPVPVDVLVCTRADIDRASAEQNHFLLTAAAGIRL